MRIVLFPIIVLLAGLLSCNTQKNTSQKVMEPCTPNTMESCMCIETWDPVCGCDNKTYPNSCHAECSGVTYVKGECKSKK